MVNRNRRLNCGLPEEEISRLLDEEASYLTPVGKYDGSSESVKRILEVPIGNGDPRITGELQLVRVFHKEGSGEVCFVPDPLFPSSNIPLGVPSTQGWLEQMGLRSYILPSERGLGESCKEIKFSLYPDESDD